MTNKRQTNSRLSSTFNHWYAVNGYITKYNYVTLETSNYIRHIHSNDQNIILDMVQCLFHVKYSSIKDWQFYK